MSFNLLDAAKGMLTNELVGKASSFLGESEGGIAKAFSGILPSVINGVTDHATSGSAGADTIARLAGEAHSGGILDNLGGFFGGNDGGSLLSKGAGLLGNLFGDKLGGLTGLISNFAGVKSSTSTSLLSMAAPMILGLLGKHAAGSGLASSAIASLLGSQKSSIASAMPSGFNLSSIFGGASDAVHKAASHTTEKVSHITGAASDLAGDAVAGGSSLLKWLLPLLLIGGAIAAGLYFWKGCSNKDAVVTDGGTSTSTTTTTGNTTGSTSTTVGTTNTTTTTTSTTAATTTVESTKVKLVNGTELNANKGGVEERLVAFAGDAAQKVNEADKVANWFDFDNLNFDLGKATITQGSMNQIANLAAILKAYPAMKIKVGGYTDASGDAAKNLTLSQQRADAVFAALKSKGVGAAQLVKAEGYGQTLAKFPATASDAERRADRRTSVKVVAK